MNSYQPCNNDYKLAMGKRLRECRIQANLTQENMAEMLDISVKHYSEVERGITGLSVNKLIELTDFLHVSMDYLVKGEEASETPLPPILIEMYKSCPADKQLYLMEIFRNVSRLIDK